MSSAKHILTDPRMAGEVRRWHTWPHLRPQSVAEHSWQSARILLALWPECPMHLLQHTLFDDIGEIASGDLPYPVKKENRDIKTSIDIIARDAHLSMCVPWGVPAPRTISDAERAIFKTAEFIEMWEWALNELKLGNQLALPVAQRCWEAIIDHLQGTPLSVQQRADAYMHRRIAVFGATETGGKPWTT